MTTQPFSINKPKQFIPKIVRDAWQLNAPLTLLALVSALVGILAGIGLAIDPRIVVGAPVWAKTTKFMLSFVAYGTTLLWMFSYIKGKPRFVHVFLNATAIILFAEMALLVTQAIRGRAMHFNYSTPLDGTLYTVMAVSIFVLWGISIVSGLIMIRQDLPGKVLSWSIKLGLLVSVLGGFGLGMLMTSPTAEQMTALQAGEPGAGQVIGAHTVGAEDGGPGLPLLGWSTTHGDLRIPHFFGLHALQVIPFVGWLLSRRREAWLSETHKLRLVFVATFGYLGWLALVTWQALRAQPFIAPDTLTLSVLAGLVIVLVSLTGLIIGHAYRRHTTNRPSPTIVNG